jgi:hypothetical protein
VQLRAAAIGAIVAVALGLAILAWIGGELHYRNCLENANMHYPVAYQQPQPTSTNKYLRSQFGLPGGQTGRGGFVIYKRAERSEAIADCSRLP